MLGLPTGKGSGHAPAASALAHRMLAAKQVTWRGQSELPQMPWPMPRPGLVLVVDMWSGIGGLLVALLALGVRCIAVSAEQDATILPSVQQHFPHVVHTETVESLKGEDFLPVLRRREFSAILLGGGSPCQGNSSLNLGRRGWQDTRSQQPLHLARLQKELREVLKANRMAIPVLSFLENVASTQKDVIAKYTDLVKGPPIVIDAEMWGWVKRHRLFWLSCMTVDGG